jgi:hypothetical protein
MIKRGLTLDNALNITSRISINGDAGPGAGAGCTTAPVRHVPRESREQCRRAPEAAGDGPRRAAVVAVTNGRLDFGTWERIFYGEFDGRRRKRVLVKIIGD